MNKYGELNASERMSKIRRITKYKERPEMEEFESEYLSQEAFDRHHGCKGILKPTKWRWGPRNPDRKWDWGPLQAYFEEPVNAWISISSIKIGERWTEARSIEQDVDRFFREISMEYYPAEIGGCADKGTHCKGNFDLHCHHITWPFKEMVQMVRDSVGFTVKDHYDWFKREKFSLTEDDPALVMFRKLSGICKYKWLCSNCHMEAHGKVVKNRIPKKSTINEGEEGSLLTGDLFAKM